MVSLNMYQHNTFNVCSRSGGSSCSFVYREFPNIGQFMASLQYCFDDNVYQCYCIKLIFS